MSYPNLNFWQTVYCWRSIVWQETNKWPDPCDFSLIAFADRAWAYFTDIRNGAFPCLCDRWE